MLGRLGLLIIALLPAGLPAWAQGVRPEWEIRDLTTALTKQMEAVEGALARIDPSAWTNAPGAYLEQYKSAVSELGYARANAFEVAAQPTGLGKSFELHLRLAAIEPMVVSVAAGSRAYQDPQPAEDALTALAAMSDSRTQLRQYLMELASTKEQQLATVDSEAQRCRAEMLSRPLPEPTAAPRPRRVRDPKTNRP
jgi:hypothetical protein